MIQKQPILSAPPKAVIFDMDGTLINSEHNYLISDRAFLSRYGVDLTEDMWESIIGIGAVALVEKLKSWVTTDKSDEVLLEEKEACYLDVARKNTIAFPEMLQLVQHLHDMSIPLAIATGSPRLTMQEMLEITDLTGYFSITVSSEEVPKGKPAPDVFLETADQLGMKAEDCLVFEDSLYGVQAAIAAGMRVVATPTLVKEVYPQDFYDADILFPHGMESFRADSVLSWMFDCCLTS